MSQSIAAAVAIIVAPGAADDHDVLLVRRATYEADPWSGHIALPGGRVELGDTSLDETARRETLEETGLDLPASSLIARLPEVSPLTLRPHVTVHPFIFSYDGRRDTVLSDEIAEAWWMPLRELRDRDAWRMVEVTTPSATYKVRGFECKGGIIWGLTERILASYLEREDAIMGAHSREQANHKMDRP